MVRILIVYNDLYMRKLISLYLRKEGYEVLIVENGEDVIELLEREKVHLVIIDMMIPKIDGWQLYQEIRQFWNLPILMIFGDGQTYCRMKGVELETHYYVIKPFDPIELVGRVKALLKRYQVDLEQVIQIGDFHLDIKTHQLRFQMNSVRVPAKEFALLYQLASYPRQTFTRAQLIEQIWGYDYPGDERTVDVHIKRLRQKLKLYSNQVKIVTVRGLGYQLEVK